MTELSNGAKQALRAAREAAEPSAAQLAHIEQGLRAKLGAAALGASQDMVSGEGGPATGAGAPATLASKSLLTGKALATIVALAAAGASLGWAFTREPGSGEVKVHTTAARAPGRSAREPNAEVTQLAGVHPAANLNRSPAVARVVDAAESAASVDPGGARPEQRGTRLGAAQKARWRRPSQAREVARAHTETEADEVTSTSTTASRALGERHESTERESAEVAERVPAAADVGEPRELAPTRARAAVPAAATLSREVPLIARAHALLTANQAQQALAVLGSYLRDFPDGTLRTEAFVTRALCYCELGAKDDAGRAFAQLKGNPAAAAHRVRLKNACQALLGETDF